MVVVNLPSPLAILSNIKQRFSFIFIATIVTYLLWYRLSSVRKPRIHSGKGRLRTFLLQKCDILSQNYWPTWWGVNCHVCTMFRACFQRKNNQSKYKRYMITLPDGGVLALDVGIDIQLPLDSPILLILPGLTGDCTMNYITHFLEDAYRTGYRPIVFNQRGSGGMNLITPRLYSATNTEDLECVIEYIKSVYPSASIIGIGVSLGGIILTRYVSDSGAKCELFAAIAVSTPLHPESSQKSLEENWWNKKVYIDILVGNLMRTVRRNVHILERNPSFNSKRLQRVNSLSQFDSVVTAPMFGYQSHTEYYRDSCLVDKLSLIQIPYIAILAEDDPFIPLCGYPIQQFELNASTFLISVKHGGHFGFIEGSFIPRGRTWLNRVNQQLLEALRHYHE